MRIIALESTRGAGSVATLDVSSGKRSVENVALPENLRTAEALIPTIGKLLEDRQWKIGGIDLICVATGPGSFTGLRIGVAAAKTLAYATGASLVGVNTLAAMASAMTWDQSLWCVLDAGRGQLFVAAIPANPTPAELREPETSVMNIDHWLGRLEPGDAACGPPMAKLQERLPTGVLVVGDQQTPTAENVGKLGLSLYESGILDDPLALVPNYYRASAAEEKAQRG